MYTVEVPLEKHEGEDLIGRCKRPKRENQNWKGFSWNRTRCRELYHFNHDPATDKQHWQWIWRRCCIAWGSREKSHYRGDGEYQEIINEKCLNCTFLYPYQNNTYLQINTWICYTCNYSLSLGNLQQWFHWHTTWIYIILKDIVQSKEKTSWETGAG